MRMHRDTRCYPRPRDRYKYSMSYYLNKYKNKKALFSVGMNRTNNISIKASHRQINKIYTIFTHMTTLKCIQWFDKINLVTLKRNIASI